MKKIALLIIAAIIACTSAVRADISPEKRQEIEKMLKLTGMEKLMGQMMDQMLASEKTSSPEIPAEFWDKLRGPEVIHELIERLMPVYDKYYSVDDLKAVNAFYSSPTGQKLMASLPQVTQESMKIGQEWGAEYAAKIMKELDEEKQKLKNK